jgi:uncharacterized protein YjbI with pentapeptide repeats
VETVMGNSEHLSILHQGVEAWNRWRDEHPTVTPELADAKLDGCDLRRYNFKEAKFIGAQMVSADLRDADFGGAFVKDATLNNAKVEGANFKGTNFFQSRLVEVDFSRSVFGGTCFLEALLWDANLSRLDLRTALFKGARLERANLSFANLSGIDLTKADFTDASLVCACLTNSELSGASFIGTNLTNADLTGANLTGAYIVGATLAGANLAGASLQAAVVINSDLRDTTLSGSKVFGISAWDLELTGAKQEDIIITRDQEPVITCDEVEVAQFIYLLLRNEKVKQVIDTVTSKAVLILGRFTDERKAVLDAIREELRRRNFTPIMFDFDKPASKDVTGTVETLARMARFIIADLTDPSSIPHELASIVPFLRTTPVLPIRLKGAGGYSMFDDFRHSYPWVLETHQYNDTASLISDLPNVISPADKMANNFRNRT